MLTGRRAGQTEVKCAYFIQSVFIRMLVLTSFSPLWTLFSPQLSNKNNEEQKTYLVYMNVELQCPLTLFPKVLRIFALYRLKSVPSKEINCIQRFVSLNLFGVRTIVYSCATVLVSVSFCDATFTKHCFGSLFCFSLWVNSLQDCKLWFIRRDCTFCGRFTASGTGYNQISRLSRLSNAKWAEIIWFKWLSKILSVHFLY